MIRIFIRTTFLIIVFAISLSILISDDSEASTTIEVEGILYELDEDVATVVDYSSTGSTVIIPETIVYNEQSYSVNAISSDAFRNNVSLYILVVPKTVSNIGSNFVAGCTSLSYLLLKESTEPVMDSDSLKVDKTCNLYTDFPFDTQKLLLYKGTTSLEMYRLKTSGALIIFNDSIHGITNYHVREKGEEFVINQSLSCQECVLLGWNCNNQMLHLGESIVVQDDFVTLTPVLERSSYDVRYYSDGVLVETRTFSVHRAPVFNFVIEKTGYSFQYWDPELCDNGDYEMTAVWCINRHVVLFTVLGQNYYDDIYDYGESIVFPPTPNITGYDFVRWESDYSGDTVPDFDLVFSAVMSIKQFDITYLDENGNPITIQTLDYGATVVPIPIPNKPGFSRVRWEPALPNRMPANNLTVTPTYSIHRHTVTF
ncbi:MAG: InlB B-repeat-containing protein, partial [Candidatus Methanomethylophilaceae archaeon]|nr:InlB B-repeat-containing protein [Candidatus Methanomethylophilaceae archaeon]